MEHIVQVNNTLIYQFINDTGDFSLVIPGIIFALMYFLKIPMYWLRNSKFPLSHNFTLIIGIILMCLGLIQFFFNTTSKFIFNKSEEKLFYITENRIKEKERRIYDLKRIKSVTITKGDKTRNDYEYFLELEFENNQPLLLAENIEDISYTEFEKEGKQIASFLNVPFRTINN